MEIINRTSLPLSGATAIVGDRHLGVQNTDLLSMSVFSNSLKLDAQDNIEQMRLRNMLHDVIGTLSPQTRTEVVAMLKDLSCAEDGRETGELLDARLPDVEKEAQKGTGFDRLVELLFMLIATLGKGNTQRSKSAASFGEIAVNQAKASGQKGMNAANIGFAMALTGFAMSAATATAGFRQQAKAASRQIDNIKKNGRAASNLELQQTHTKNALGRQNSPMTGTTPQEKLNVLETAKGPVHLQPNRQDLAMDELQTLSQPATDTQALIAAKKHTYDELQLKHTLMQQKGMAIGAMVMPVNGLLQSVGGMASASETAAAKANEAQGTVASSVQRSEDEASQRSTELVQKMFALILSMSEQNRSTLDAMSQAIRV